MSIRSHAYAFKAFRINVCIGTVFCSLHALLTVLGDFNVY